MKQGKFIAYILIMVLCFILYLLTQLEPGDLATHPEFAPLSDALSRHRLPWFGASVEPLWVPIAVNNLNDDDPTVELCPLDFLTQYRDPARYPMFKDLVSMSGCSGKQRSVLLSQLERELVEEAEAGVRTMEPTGFVFHESRCGSTLVANMLAALPDVRLYSESDPPVALVRHVAQCEGPAGGCSPEERATRIRRLQLVVRLMGKQHAHKENIRQHSRLFFKMQSINSQFIHIVREAFPDTPWVFIFREPVEVMMSHLKGENSAGAVCLRGRSMPPELLMETTGLTMQQARRLDDESYCAAHLGMLCANALRELRRSEDASGRALAPGLALHYSSLPDAFLDAVLPAHFGVVPDRAQLDYSRLVARSYSKGRGGARSGTFQEDSAQKLAAAPPAVLAAAAKYMSPSYEPLQDAAAVALAQLSGKLAEKSPPPLKPSQGGFCPAQAPITKRNSYPVLYPLMDILKNWPADVTDVPPRVFDSLCHFDYLDEAQRQSALDYRDAELPFVIHNVPEHVAAVEKWTWDYLKGAVKGNHKMEVSQNNHFMYWTSKGAKDWVQPTRFEDRPFSYWFDKASNDLVGPGDVHYYYRVSTETGVTKASLRMNNPDNFVEKDMPIFQNKPSLFIKDPNGQRGIHCRFGMRGVIAESHFDGGRNMIAMMKGSKRYILQPPSQCGSVYLLPKEHPSGRHSEVNWSDPDLEKYPKFAQSMAHEVVLSAGDILYLPSHYLHFIVSLGLNVQCNTRSGLPPQSMRKDTQACGF